MRNLLRRLIGWTTLYTGGDKVYFDMPGWLLRLARKKTWFRKKSRERGSRFGLTIIYYSLFMVPVWWNLVKQGKEAQSAWVLGGGGFALNSAAWLIRRTISLVIEDIFLPGEIFRKRHRMSKLELWLMLVTALPFVWVFSGMIYGLVYGPIFGLILLVGEQLIFLVGIYTGLWSVKFGYSVAVLLAAILAASTISWLQYWASTRKTRE